MIFKKGMYFIKTNTSNNSCITGKLIEQVDTDYCTECWYVEIIADNRYDLYSNDGGKHGVIVQPRSTRNFRIDLYNSYDELIAKLI